MGERRNGRHASELLDRADQLKANPKHQREPSRQANPAEVEPIPKKKAEADARELQRVEHNHTGNAAARANARNGRPWISGDVQEIADEGRHDDEQQVAGLAQKTLRVIAEDEKEIEIAHHVNHPAMQKKGGEKSQAVMTPGLRRDKPVFIYPVPQIGHGPDAD